MATVRLEKMSALVRKELALIFQQNMKKLFNGVMITVTRVRLAPDLGTAKAYLSFFPSEKAQAELKNVESHTKYIRKMLGDKTGGQLRRIPDLSFFLDDSMDYFEEIDRLLKTT
ncbi:MAG: 30S ribosome-binding factor RbfA [Flavobacteriales bacterium]|nr:30S ribosome-binding factor RbfA [Flavobacteriales bacterium]